MYVDALLQNKGTDTETKKVFVRLTSVHHFLFIHINKWLFKLGIEGGVLF